MVWSYGREWGEWVKKYKCGVIGTADKLHSSTSLLCADTGNKLAPCLAPSHGIHAAKADDELLLSRCSWCTTLLVWKTKVQAQTAV